MLYLSKIKFFQQRITSELDEDWIKAHLAETINDKNLIEF